jgi:pilus assembly protein CpaF
VGSGFELVSAPEPQATWTPSPATLQHSVGPVEAGPQWEAPSENAVWNLGADGTAEQSVAEPVESTSLVPTHQEIVETSNDASLPALREDEMLPEHLIDLKRRAQEALIERMGARLYDRTLTEDQLENLVLTQLDGFLADSFVEISPAERLALTDDLINDVLRHGPIERYLQDPSVSEVMVNGINNIYVERGGKLQRASAYFVSEAHLRQIIERIVSKVGRRIDESSPMVDARLPDGSRVNAVVPPLAVDGPSLTIRKFSQESLTINDLVHFGTLSPSSVQFLSACVRGRLNVLVSGGTGTGKTTLLNVLSNFIPENERIVTIEDAVELQLRQEHIVRLESRPPNVEGKGAVTIRDLVRNSLRMRPDRVIIGECRGGEALDMLQAMNTGHDGSLSTLHANGPRDAIARMETLCLMAGMDLPIKAIREQVASAVDLIVHVARLRDGSRRVTHITEVIGLDGERMQLGDVFTFDFDAGLDPEGRYCGLLEPTGIAPTVLQKLKDHGIEVPVTLFEPDDATAGSAW